MPSAYECKIAGESPACDDLISDILRRVELNHLSGLLMKLIQRPQSKRTRHIAPRLLLQDERLVSSPTNLGVCVDRLCYLPNQELSIL